MTLSVLCKSLIGKRIPEDILQRNWKQRDDYCPERESCEYQWYRVTRYTKDENLIYEIEIPSGYRDIDYMGTIYVHLITDLQNVIRKVDKGVYEFITAGMAGDVTLKLREKWQLESMIKHIFKLEEDPRIVSYLGREIAGLESKEWSGSDESKLVNANNYTHRVSKPGQLNNEIFHVLSTDSLSRADIEVLVWINTNLKGLITSVDIQSGNKETIDLGLDENEMQQGLGLIESVIACTIKQKT